MEKQDLISRINEAIAEEFEIEVTEITPDANIKETLMLHSLSLVDLVALIENSFNVKIKGTELTSILTFGSLYDFVYEKMGNK